MNKIYFSSFPLKTFGISFENIGFEVDFLAFCAINKSITTNAAILSTIGTARGNTHGS